MSITLQIFFAAYGLVFIAEIVGDKLLYTTGILAARFRVASVVIGVLVAFVIKMGAAVFIAGFVTELPRTLVAAITAANFAGIAVVLWRRPDILPETSEEERSQHSTREGILVSLAAVVFSEWGDVGQVTAAAVALKFSEEYQGTGWEHRALLVVWCGAVAAMMTKGALAATAGMSVRRWVHNHIKPRTVRVTAVALLLLVGSLSVLEILGYLPR